MNFKKEEAVIVNGRTALIKEIKWNMVQVQYGDGRYEWLEIKRIERA